MAKQVAQRRNLDRDGVTVCALGFPKGDPRHGTVRSYVARWTDPATGRQEQQSFARLGLTTEAQRKDWAAKRARALDADRAAFAASGGVVRPPKPVAEAVKDWLGEFQHGTTAASYKMIVTRFSAWLTARRVGTVQEIRDFHLTEYRKDYLRDAAFAPKVGAKQGTKGAATKRRKPATINLGLTVAKMFLEQQRKLRLTPFLTSAIIAESLENLTGTALPKAAIVFLRPAQIRQLLEAADRHDRTTANKPIAAFVLLVLLTGFRFDEAASLRWSEVDLQAGEITLPPERVKTRKGRVVRLNVSPTALDLLRRMKLQATGPMVFDVERGRAEDARRRLVKTFGAPKFKWHDLRRTAGTIMSNAPGIFGGAAEWHSAKRLGHSVAIAEANYADLLHDLPTDAKTIEDAANIREQCQRIVESVGGVTTSTTATAIVSATG